MRIVIIGFALAMVIIGAYPFRRHFRTQLHDMRALVRRELGDYLPGHTRAGETPGSRESESSGGGRAAGDGRAALRLPGSDSARRRDQQRSAEPRATAERDTATRARNLDHLSEDDRRELDTLLNR